MGRLLVIAWKNGIYGNYNFHHSPASHYSHCLPVFLSKQPPDIGQNLRTLSVQFSDLVIILNRALSNVKQS